MFKSAAVLSMALVALVVCSAPAEARPKRSILYAASPLIQTVPVVQQTETVSQVVHNSPTTVVKTEQVSGVDRSSYSYSSEVKNNIVSHPVSHTTSTVTHHAVAAAPIATVAHVAPVAHVGPVAHVATVSHVAPIATHYAAAPAITYYSPYHYIVGK